jgi:hypothetical protein
MSSRRRERKFGVLRDGIEEVFELLEWVLGQTVVRANPDTRDDCLLNPSLVFFPEQPDIDQIIQCLAGSHITRSCQRDAA